MARPKLWNNGRFRLGLTLLLLAVGGGALLLVLAGQPLVSAYLANAPKHRTSIAVAVARGPWGGSQTSSYRLTLSLVNYTFTRNNTCRYTENTLSVSAHQLSTDSRMFGCQDLYSQIIIERGVRQDEYELEASDAASKIELQLDPDAGFITRYVLYPDSPGAHPVVVTIENLTILR